LLAAPEGTHCKQAAMGSLVALIALGQSLILLATLVVLLMLPGAALMAGLALLLMRACGWRLPQGTLMRWAARGELLLSAVLVGVLSIEVPPPPPPVEPW